jgi:hypothetical protein
VLIVGALIALVGSAFAAQAGNYRGKTVSGKRPVTFKLSGGKVRNFVGGINLYCFNGVGQPGSFKFDAVVPPRAIAVRGSRFNYVGKDKPRTGKIEIHGRFVSRRKAKGWIQLGTGNCSGKTDFWATRRS